MNVDDDSNNATQSSVTSKFFNKKNNVDESLTDFQETKKSVIGPKNTNKGNKSKPKKSIKKIKGQKDIRTVLKPKKNELIKYSEEFDDVCKKSGIDVDSDQLQVLIAISKSLQKEESDKSLKLNSQERKSSIRKTLQEYGFKVPDIKITDKKVKKIKKQYKLLTRTIVEKQQIISDRYSEILLKNLESHSKNFTSNELIPLYNIATNAVYDAIRDNSVYYVNNLVERSNTDGCLFKDYADIPGRPASPKLLKDYSKMNFSEINCSQEELDLVLSGTIKSAKNVLKSKQVTIDIKNVVNKNGNKKHLNEEIINENCQNFENNHVILQENKNVDDEKNGKEKNSGTTNRQLLTITQSKQYRSCSPDIFDDEELSIVDDNETDNNNTNNSVSTIDCDGNLQNNSKNSIIQNLKTKHELSIKQIDMSPLTLLDDKTGSKIAKIIPYNFESVTFRNKEYIPLSQGIDITKQTNDFMDLTECVQSKNVFCMENTEVCQYNKTRRKSNDLMEITECIGSKAIDHIDLTQCNHETAKKEHDIIAENVDLTQSSNSNESNDELPFVCLNKSNSLDATAILDENEYIEVSNKPINLNNQVLNLSDDSMDGKCNKSIFEDYVHNHSESSRESGDIKIIDNINNKLNVESTGDMEVNIHLSQIATNSNQLNTEDMNSENSLKVSLESHNAQRNLKSNHININDSGIIQGDRIKSNTRPKYSNENNYLLESLHSQNEENSHQNVNSPINDNIDLTQSSNSDKEYNEVSDFNKLETSQNEPCTSSKNSPLNSTSKEKHNNSDENECPNIDLTQDTCDYYETLKNPGNLPKISSLCQKNNVSVDYDEINYVYETNNCVAYHNDMGIDISLGNNNQSIDYNNIDSKRNLETDCSQHSGNLEISDKELDYSLYKSSHKNFDESGELSKLVCHKIKPCTHRKDQLYAVNTISNETNSNADEKEYSNKDFTQNTNHYYDTLKASTQLQRYNTLDEKNNTCLDYDGDEDDYETNKSVTFQSGKEVNMEHGNNGQSIMYDNTDSKKNIETDCSQQTEVFEICDQELDYSVHKSRHENFEIGGLSIINNFSKIDKQTPDTVESRMSHETNSSDLQSCEDVNIKSQATPKVMSNNRLCMNTPGNSEYIIKINEVTPMLSYESLSTPERNQELDKYGIKPLKRKRAIQLLTHLYNQTHPIVESCLEDLPSPLKRLCTSKTHLKSPRRLISTHSLSETSPGTHENIDGVISEGFENSSGTSRTSKSPTKKSTPNTLGHDSKPPIKYSKSPRKNSKSPHKSSKSPKKGTHSPRKDYDLETNCLGSQISAENVYEVTNENPCVKNIDCEDDLVFQKREKAKVHSCRVPLHITFHNYISSRNGLRESILRYEPVNIDVIHKDLVSYGHRYDPKDLLKFMDKKCITVKTSDNNARNERH